MTVAKDHHLHIGRFRLYYLVPYVIIILLFSFIAFQLNANNNDSCVQSAKNSIVINQFLDLLIDVTQSSSQRTPEQKIATVKQYNELKIDIPACYTPPKD